MKRLRRDRLRNVVLLKYIAAYGAQAVLHQIVRGSHTASMVLLDNALNGYDRRTYPLPSHSVVIVSDDVTLTRELLNAVPQETTLVFKLESEADRAAVTERFALVERATFLSFTDGQAQSADEEADLDAATPFQLFAGQGHSREWLARLLETDRAFARSITEGGDVQSACFAFEVDGPVWEIGGVVSARKREAAGWHRGRCEPWPPNSDAGGWSRAIRWTRPTSPPSAPPRRG